MMLFLPVPWIPPKCGRTFAPTVQQAGTVRHRTPTSVTNACLVNIQSYTRLCAWTVRREDIIRSMGILTGTRQRVPRVAWRASSVSSRCGPAKQIAFTALPVASRTNMHIHTATCARWAPGQKVKSGSLPAWTCRHRARRRVRHPRQPRSRRRARRPHQRRPQHSCPQQALLQHQPWLLRRARRRHQHLRQQHSQRHNRRRNRHRAQRQAQPPNRRQRPLRRRRRAPPPRHMTASCRSGVPGTSAVRRAGGFSRGLRHALAPSLATPHMVDMCVPLWLKRACATCSTVLLIALSPALENLARVLAHVARACTHGSATLFRAHHTVARRALHSRTVHSVTLKSVLSIASCQRGARGALVPLLVPRAVPPQVAHSSASAPRRAPLQLVA